MKFYIFLISIGLICACSEEEKQEKKQIEFNNEDSIDLNKQLLEEENLQIDLYLTHHSKWKMITSGTGLRYQIYQDVKGPLPKLGMKAGFAMKIELLDGTKCYATPDDMVDEIVVDKSDIESGILEAVKMMSVGDKAKLIVPAHLAHGITGDLKSIPPVSTLVVDIELISLK